MGTRLALAGLFTAYGLHHYAADLGPFIARAVAWRVGALRGWLADRLDVVVVESGGGVVRCVVLCGVWGGLDRPDSAPACVVALLASTPALSHTLPRYLK